MIGLLYPAEEKSELSSPTPLELDVGAATMGFFCGGEEAAVFLPDSDGEIELLKRLSTDVSYESRGVEIYGNSPVVSKDGRDNDPGRETAFGSLAWLSMEAEASDSPLLSGEICSRLPRRMVG